MGLYDASMKRVHRLAQDIARRDVAMTWTKEKPTEPGWYWWVSSATPAMALIIMTEEGGLVVQFDNGHCTHLDALCERAKNLKWAGPIAPPVEP